PPDRARRRHRQVVAVVGLDFVDRGEDLPGNAVLGRGGLVDGEQEQGNAVVGERLHRGGGAGELGRQQARLRGHRLRRGGAVVARRGALFRASAGLGGGRFGLGFG